MKSEDLRHRNVAQWGLMATGVYRPLEDFSLLCNHLQATLMAYGECGLSRNYKNKIKKQNIILYDEHCVLEQQIRTT